jgi:hypothetical protein
VESGNDEAIDVGTWYLQLGRESRGRAKPKAPAISRDSSLSRLSLGPRDRWDRSRDRRGTGREIAGHPGMRRAGSLDSPPAPWTLRVAGVTARCALKLCTCTRRNSGRSVALNLERSALELRIGTAVAGSVRAPHVGRASCGRSSWGTYHTVRNRALEIVLQKSSWRF